MESNRVRQEITQKRNPSDKSQAGVLRRLGWTLLPLGAVTVLGLLGSLWLESMPPIVEGPGEGSGHTILSVVFGLAYFALLVTVTLGTFIAVCIQLFKTHRSGEKFLAHPKATTVTFIIVLGIIAWNITQFLDKVPK
ncbi:MAG: hypothetical protein WDZ82_03480 [Candidatus Paceibacterota bacterium]